MTLEQLFSLMTDKKASDVFLAPGSPITVKVDGVCVAVSPDRLSASDVVTLLADRLTEAHFQELDEQGELNISVAVQADHGSFRLSAFRQRGRISAVLRHIPGDIPALDQLHLPAVFKQLALARRGLVLVVGAAGSGKSTSIASMLDYRNERQTGHILTFEDPIEFQFRNKKSIVNQREIGSDTPSLESALQTALRQAPDVLFIGEIRDRETMSAALAYALSGHYVLATLHATNCTNAISRIAHFFPPETREMLFDDIANSLRAVVCQRLVRATGGGRIPGVEVLMNAGHMRDLILRGDLSSIKEALSQSLVPENVSFEQSLFQLLQDQKISREDALDAADSQNNLLWLINNQDAASPQIPEPPPAPKGASFSEFTLNL